MKIYATGVLRVRFDRNDNIDGRIVGFISNFLNSEKGLKRSYTTNERIVNDFLFQEETTAKRLLLSQTCASTTQGLNWTSVNCWLIEIIDIWWERIYRCFIPRVVPKIIPDKKIGSYKRLHSIGREPREAEEQRPAAEQEFAGRDEVNFFLVFPIYILSMLFLKKSWKSSIYLPSANRLLSFCWASNFLYEMVNQFRDVRTLLFIIKLK